MSAVDKVRHTGHPVRRGAATEADGNNLAARSLALPIGTNSDLAIPGMHRFARDLETLISV